MKTYQVNIAGEWFTVKGVVTPKGWLDWKSRNGEVGLSRPEKFREPIKKGKKKTDS